MLYAAPVPRKSLGLVNWQAYIQPGALAMLGSAGPGYAEAEAEKEEKVVDVALSYLLERINGDYLDFDEKSLVEALEVKRITP